MASRGWERDVDLHQRNDDRRSSVDVPSPTEGERDVDGGVTAPVGTQKRQRNLLRESHLISAEGFQKVHRTFPYQVSADVSGREAQALASLVKMYKQWAFDLYPGLNFEDFVERTETLGKGRQVQALMMELREKERLKYLKTIIDQDEKDEKADSEGEEAML
ncbi:timeless-interacting protein isoform x3 [Plasmopara halstedii]|uniref:Timeless-interacting protein isoform x3 n=1 Tax=Plasmopara halstedii TaxID=4781 RepID=A0A0P1APB5_PLAHL|nr:timeless-interacting protein isoform x3 [Plasmopara halstedii]CEG43375.1 timeless-interacting protein isoform x3 [Plasmopara halstedii]|eukprot:XP_024579744.1 timeless-interacting protein isoform x3 [Plasmopara halstedii]